MEITIDLNWVLSLYNLITKDLQSLGIFFLSVNLGFGFLAQFLTIKRVKEYLKDRSDLKICTPSMVLHFIVQIVSGLSFWLVKIIILILLYPVISLAIGAYFNPFKHLVIGTKEYIKELVIEKEYLKYF